MAGQPIPASQASAMIGDYIVYMSELGVDMETQTQSVSFTGDTIFEWLSDVMPYADELRVFMGRYPEGHEHAGRTTVILWPYKHGEPATRTATVGKGGGGEDDGGDGLPPYNEGQGNP